MTQEPLEKQTIHKAENQKGKKINVSKAVGLCFKGHLWQGILYMLMTLKWGFPRAFKYLIRIQNSETPLPGRVSQLGKWLIFSTSQDF